MGVNKAEQGVDNNLVNTVADHERQLTELKTHPQPIGADVLDVVESGFLTTSPIAVSAGNWLNFIVTITPRIPILTLYDIEITIYIDGTGFNDRYPNGSNLTTGMKGCRMSWWQDYELTDTVSTMQRVFIVHVENTDSVSHNFTLKTANILPIMPLT